jgi:hypothetical protein
MLYNHGGEAWSLWCLLLLKVHFQHFIVPELGHSMQQLLHRHECALPAACAQHLFGLADGHARGQCETIVCGNT